MKDLFIGGTGEISAACSQRAVELGIDLVLLTRGRGATRPVPEAAELLQADIRDPAATRAAIGTRDFDVVVNFGDAILAADETWGRSLLGDKAHSVIFDNSKIRGVVPDYVASIPFSRGAREIIAWYDEDPSRRDVDARLDTLLDRLVETHRPSVRATV